MGEMVVVILNVVLPGSAAVAVAAKNAKAMVLEVLEVVLVYLVKDPMVLGELAEVFKASRVLEVQEVNMVEVSGEAIVIQVEFVLSGPVTLVHSHQLA
jgi:hypothetical protein